MSFDDDPGGGMSTNVGFRLENLLNKKVKKNKTKRRANLDDVQSRAELVENRDVHQKRIETLCEELKAAKEKKKRDDKSIRKARLTESVRNSVKEAKKMRHRVVRASQTPEEIDDIKTKDKSAHKKKWESISQELKAAINTKKRDDEASREASLTESQRESQRVGNKLSQQNVRSSQTPDKSEQLKATDNASHRTGYHSLSQEEQQVLRDKRQQQISTLSIAAAQALKENQSKQRKLRRHKSSLGIKKRKEEVKDYSEELLDVEEDPSVNDPSFFDYHELNEHLAHLFLVSSSGLVQLPLLDDYNTLVGEGVEVADADVDKVVAEVSEVVMKMGELMTVVKKHQARQNVAASLLSCACCGVRGYVQNVDDYSHIPIEELDILKCTETKIKQINDCGMYKKIWSYWQADANTPMYNLHPEFVDKHIVSISSQDSTLIDYESVESKTSYTACICKSCTLSLKRKNKPLYSIANGVDYGLLTRVTSEKLNLSTLALMAISPGRLFMVVTKISGAHSGQLKTKGQSISFPQPDHLSVIQKSKRETAAKTNEL